jgi:hypothetical protein
MGLLSQSAVPIRLPADLMNQFEQRFSSPEDLDAQLNGILASAIPPTNSVYEQVAAFLHTARVMNSQTASDAARVGDHHLRSVYNAVANVGLHVFAPDVFGNPESLYNLAHEHVAIHSFRTIASLFAYSSIYRVDLSLIKDDHFLRRFYRSFIYGRMKDLASKEERRPGRVGVDIVLNNIYRRRDEVCFTPYRLLLAHVISLDAGLARCPNRRRLLHEQNRCALGSRERVPFRR